MLITEFLGFGLTFQNNILAAQAAVDRKGGCLHRSVLNKLIDSFFFFFLTLLYILSWIRHGHCYGFVSCYFFLFFSFQYAD